jgi:hypothetical protein
MCVYVCSVHACLRIITASVSYRHKSSAYNTLFHFHFSQLWSYDFFLKFAVKFALSLWYIIDKKHKNIYSSLHIGKILPRFREYGLVNRFTDHVNTRLVITSNYSATANLHTSQITAANTKCSPARSVFTSRSLVKDGNSKDSSASRAQVLPVRRVSRNCALSIPLGRTGVLVI